MRPSSAAATLAMATALCCATWVAPVAAQAGFIGPGQEELVADMLGRGVDLPSHCRFDGAAILATSIRGRYVCAADRQVVVVLRPRTEDPGEGVATRRFVLSTEGESAPQGLVDALAERIRVREGTWGVSNPEETGSEGAAVARSAPSRPWLLGVAAALVSLLAVAIGRRRRGEIPTRDLVAGAASFAVALIMRLALGTWGPFHANGQAPAWIASGAWGLPWTAVYGPGFQEIYLPVAALSATSPDTAIFACNALISAAAVPLLYALARTSGLSWLKALALAALLAVDPSMLRVSATESYFVPIITLLIASRLALVSAAKEAAARAWSVAAGLGLLGAVLAAQAARIHPSAWLGVALLGGGAWMQTALPAVRARLAVFAAWNALLGAVIALTSLAWLYDVWTWTLRWSAGSSTPILSLSSLLFLPVLIGLAILAAGMRNPARRSLLLAAIVDLVILGATRHVYAQNRLQAVVFERLFLPAVVVGAAAMIPDKWFDYRAFRAALAAVVVAVPVVFWPVVRGRTTEHLEYQWLRAQFRMMDPSCVVLHVANAGDRILHLPEYTAPGRSAARPLAIPYRQEVDALGFREPSSCVYVLWSSLCNSEEGRPVCERMAGGMGLEEIARASFPAYPTHRHQPYDRDPVEVILWRSKREAARP